MQLKSKAFLLLLTVFMVGLITGALGHRAWLRSHFEKVAAFRGQGGPPGRVFAEIIEKRIQPSDAQRDKIRALLSRHDKRIILFREKQHHEIALFMDSLKNELDPLLTPQQRKRLKSGRQKPVGFGPIPPPDKGLMHSHSPNLSGSRFIERKLVDRLAAVIEPDSSQYDTVMAILLKTGKTFSMRIKERRPPAPEQFESLRTMLAPHLSDIQLKRLNEELEKIQAFQPPFKRGVRDSLEESRKSNFHQANR